MIFNILIGIIALSFLILGYMTLGAIYFRLWNKSAKIIWRDDPLTLKRELLTKENLTATMILWPLMIALTPFIYGYLLLKDKRPRLIISLLNKIAGIK